MHSSLCESSPRPYHSAFVGANPTQTYLHITEAGRKEIYPTKSRQSLVFLSENKAPTNTGSLAGIVKCAVGEVGSTPGEVLENTERLFQPRLAPSVHEEQHSNATAH